MKKKYINITQEFIKNLSVTDFCFDIIHIIWNEVNIYDGYEEYEKTLKPYTLEQRYLLAMHWLAAEVSNGGFIQFLDNSIGIVWEDAYKGYQAIGSNKLIALIDNLIKIYGKKPNFDREIRWKEMENFSNEKFEEIDSLSYRYYELEEEEWKKVNLWIKANSEKFLIQGEVEDYNDL